MTSRENNLFFESFLWAEFICAPRKFLNTLFSQIDFFAFKGAL